MKIKILILLGFLILFSCRKPKVWKEIYSNVIFESGRIHDSIPWKLTYMTYNINYGITCTKHEYRLDSSLAIGTEIVPQKKNFEELKSKFVYYQSIKKDTLVQEIYKQDSIVEDGKTFFVLADSIVLQFDSVENCIYKYKLPNPAVDGDRTIFFNQYWGLIESYNIGWGDRHTMIDNSLKDKRIIKKLLFHLKTQNPKFYYHFPFPRNYMELDALLENADSIMEMEFDTISE